MPLPLTVSCFSKIQIVFTFLVPAHPRSPGKQPLCGCVCDGLMFVDERDRYPRDDWETRYPHEQNDRRRAAEDYREVPAPLPAAPAGRDDLPRVKTEEQSLADKATAPSSSRSSCTIYSLLFLASCLFLFAYTIHWPSVL